MEIRGATYGDLKRAMKCPFCGHSARIGGIEKPILQTYMFCEFCGARGAYVYGGYGGATKNALELWNQRVDAPTSETDDFVYRRRLV